MFMASSVILCPLVIALSALVLTARLGTVVLILEVIASAISPGQLGETKAGAIGAQLGLTVHREQAMAMTATHSRSSLE
jgi:hypothetical protein